jgi:predicted transcriptional regulator of viral defense system
MTLQDRPSLSSYMDRLLSSGQVAFTSDEAKQALGLKHRALLDAAERQQRQQRLIGLRHGFYVIVPPQYLSWGAPPPAWYIDDLMRHEGHTYYVALLKAAELHGATHQAVMEFQVATEKRLPTIHAGRSIITFHYRKNMAAVQSGVEKTKTESGYMNISSPELTVLDLVRYPRASGGIDNIATIIAELGGKLDIAKLAGLAPQFELSVIQRLGYLLARFGHADRAERLYRRLPSGTVLPWVELEPAQAKRNAPFTSAPIQEDERWRVIVRRLPERDE